MSTARLKHHLFSKGIGDRPRFSLFRR